MVDQRTLVDLLLDQLLFEPLVGFGRDLVHSLGVDLLLFGLILFDAAQMDFKGLLLRVLEHEVPDGGVRLCSV